MYSVNAPEVFVTFAADKFDENGKLVDDKAKELIGILFNNLVSLATKLEQGG